MPRETRKVVGLDGTEKKRLEEEKEEEFPQSSD